MVKLVPRTTAALVAATIVAQAAPLPESLSSNFHLAGEVTKTHQTQQIDTEQQEAVDLKARTTILDAEHFLQQSLLADNAPVPRLQDAPGSSWLKSFRSLLSSPTDDSSLPLKPSLLKELQRSSSKTVESKPRHGTKGDSSSRPDNGRTASTDPMNLYNIKRFAPKARWQAKMAAQANAYRYVS